ncbi:MAG: hypothetical protein QOE14_2591 [Humisphaera sp.]|nr:hypothetical protein [Humisphaera sp.]
MDFKMIRRFFAVALLVSLVFVRPAGAAEMPEMNLRDFNDVAGKHPAGEALKRLFPGGAAKPAENFQPTGLSKKDYLKLIAGNVDFWKQHLSPAGAILDPYEKHKDTGANLEKQYSTPAFASAAALLVKEAGRDDLLEPASRAFDFALTALLNKTTANQHPDFYIPMLVHAYRILHDRAPKEQAAKWEQMMKSIVPNGPEGLYKDQTAGANWNVVNVAGEALRRKTGLVVDDQKEAQQKYLDDMLARQQRRFTKFGLYEDPNVPMAYDAFPRLWLEEMIADGAYDGPAKAQLERFLTLGGLSSLLLLSPQGEWPNGGRSAQHQWNEAEIAAICEINANKWNRAGRADVAGSFKRAAHLALKSMSRWQRPSGELFIVKNRAEPEQRHGFEGYSFHSQYNLLPMGMLAIAYTRADDSIAEKPTPAETGGYVFDVREKFHKIAAAAGGYYVLIDTSADEHYDGTGVQRVHRAGVELSPLSGSAAPDRWYGPHPRKDLWAITPGIQWKDSEDGRWRGLAQYHLVHAPPKGEQPNPNEPIVKNAELIVADEKSDRVAFTVKYELAGEGARPVEESFVITKDGVGATSAIRGDAPLAATRALFPALVNDGANDVETSANANKLTVRRPGGALTWKIVEPANVALQLTGPRVATHNGCVQACVGDLPSAAPQVQWKVTLQPAPLESKR